MLEVIAIGPNGDIYVAEHGDPNGDIYVAEHGDNSDDEINRLQPGGNYGWPYISGYKDNKAISSIIGLQHQTARI